MTLARWQATIVDTFGNVQPGASVEVRQENLGAQLATIYSDRNGTIVSPNPFNADSNGFAFFHASGGAYKITATLGGFSVVWRYVGIGKGNESDLNFVRAQGAWNSGTTYIGGDLVYRSGYLFLSRTAPNLNHVPDTTTPGDTTDWMYMGPAVQGPGANSIYAAASDEAAPLVAKTAAVTFRAVGSLFLVKVRASVNHAPVGAPTIIDIKVNGTSILSTKLQIDTGAKTSVGSAVTPVISSAVLNDDDEITIDIVSTGTGASGLKIALISSLN